MINQYPPELITAFEAILETNRRLNRRCQEQEHRIAMFEKAGKASQNSMRVEANRMCRYAGALRDIYQHHRVRDRSFGCWFCKFKRRIRGWVWNTMFAMTGGEE